MTAWWQVPLFIAGYVIINGVVIFVQSDLRDGRHYAEQPLFDAVSAMVGRVDDRRVRGLISEDEVSMG